MVLYEALAPTFKWYSFMNQDFPEDEIRIEVFDGVGVITLNRPEVLNALSLEMVRRIAAALHRWRDDSSVNVVVFQGAGERAFCAGGDIKAFYFAGMDYRRGLVSARVPVVFFAEEYSLNKQIFHYSKPTIAIMDGFTMGGGYGIAGHCSIRVATDKTVFAMPEAGIGFFPDVGSLYHLHKCPRNYGRYLALTGQGIDGQTACAAGLADMFIHSSDVNRLMDAVRASAGKADLQKALEKDFGKPECNQIEHADIIEHVFEVFDLHEILKRLESSKGEFSEKARQVLRQRSPISLAVTAAYLEKSQNMDFDDIIATDFVLVQNFVRQPDMYEGIRAQLIDKDKEPRWLPESLEEVNEENINAYFTSSGYDLKDVQIF